VVSPAGAALPPGELARAGSSAYKRRARTSTAPNATVDVAVRDGPRWEIPARRSPRPCAARDGSYFDSDCTWSFHPVRRTGKLVYRNGNFPEPQRAPRIAPLTSPRRLRPANAAVANGETSWLQAVLALVQRCAICSRACLSSSAGAAGMGDAATALEPNGACAPRPSVDRAPGEGATATQHITRAYLVIPGLFPTKFQQFCRDLHIPRPRRYFFGLGNPALPFPIVPVLPQLPERKARSREIRTPGKSWDPTSAGSVMAFFGPDVNALHRRRCARQAAGGFDGVLGETRLAHRDFVGNPVIWGGRKPRSRSQPSGIFGSHLRGVWPPGVFPIARSLRTSSYRRGWACERMGRLRRFPP